MYDPPSPKIFNSYLDIIISYIDIYIYDKGYAAAHLGRTAEENPYHSDLAYWWMKGFDDYYE